MLARGLLAVAVVLVQVIAVGVLVPSDWLVEQTQAEQRMLAGWLGEATATRVVERSNAAYEALLVEPGIVEGVTAHLTLPGGEPRDSGFQGVAETVFPYVEQRLKVLWTAIYQLIMRAQILGIWLPYLLPLWIPALWQGFANRRIKQVSYGYAAPNRFHLAFMALLVTVAAVPIYLFLPLAVPPLAVPAWGIALAGVLILGVSNLQKQL